MTDQKVPTPRHSDRATMHERPAVMPRDPADVAADRFERTFVMERRTRGVSWFNISRMTGRTVPYLKALYDEAAS